MKYLEDRMFGKRCTRCLESIAKGVMVPIMGCMMILCQECTVGLLKDGVIPPKTKAHVVKLKKKGGDT